MGIELTDRAVKRLPAPAQGKQRIYYDAAVAGFGVRITAAGAKSFVLNYRTKGGRERRITIGAFPDWQAAAARKEAARLKQQIDQGGDPLADLEAEREAPTVAELCDRFEQEHLPRLRPSSAADYRRILKNHIRPHFGPHIKVGEVGFADLDRLHRKITANGHLHRANRTLAVAGKMFSLAMKWRMRPDNPVKHVERNQETKRKRYLSAEELVRLTAALSAHQDRQAANIIRLLLLTGARRGEVLAMRWADLDLAQGGWLKPASTTKQKSDHHVPLSAPARQMLQEIFAAQTKLAEFVFPGRDSETHRTTIKKNWAAVCAAADISGLRLHDLRHSFASQLASAGISLPVIGALLGHSNPTTTHRYAHLFSDPLRAATERVGAIVTNAGQPAAEPVKLKKGV